MGGALDRFNYVPDGRITHADALCEFIREEIAFGRIKAGETLPTIKDLARQTGLSFRLARGVVERLAREGFVRSRPRVGSVVLQRDTAILNGRVLFVVPDVDTSSYHVMQIAAVLRRRMAENGYAFSTCVFSQNPRNTLPFLKQELLRPPDLAIVLYSMPHVRKCLRAQGVRSVYVYGDKPEGDGEPWLRFSAAEAIEKFVAHCVRAGVKKVTEVRFFGNETPEARIALAKEGISSRMMTIPRHDELGRYEGIERQAFSTFCDIPKQDFPDVFLFWDDFVAQGALTAFLKRGIRLPEDVSVVSLSNKGLGPVYVEPITRFECDAAMTGEIVSSFSLSVLAKGRMPPVPTIYPQYVFGSTFPY